MSPSRSNTSVRPSGLTSTFIHVPSFVSNAIVCDGPNGCYNCKPTTPVQVLNACTDASCEPFANTKERLPLLNEDGTLPPLP